MLNMKLCLARWRKINEWSKLHLRWENINIFHHIWILENFRDTSIIGLYLQLLTKTWTCKYLSGKTKCGLWRSSINGDFIWRYPIESKPYSFYLHTYIPERMLHIMIWTLDTCHILLNQMIDNYIHVSVRGKKKS